MSSVHDHSALSSLFLSTTSTHIRTRTRRRTRRARPVAGHPSSHAFERSSTFIAPVCCPGGLIFLSASGPSVVEESTRSSSGSSGSLAAGTR